MADSETTPETTKPRSPYGWLPKLILWGVVFAFGYLYLSSLDRTTGDALLERISKLSPIPISALPGMAPASAPAKENPVAANPVPASPAVTHPVAQSAAQAPVMTAPVVAATSPAAAANSQQPVNQAESAVFANSLMRQETAPNNVASPSPSAPATQQQTPAVSQQMPVMPPQSPVAAAPSAMTPSAQTAPDWNYMAQQRAMIQAQYEAMRREADARMRQYWSNVRAAGSPPAMPYPYGYPAYPAGYGSETQAPQR